jgi:2-keto-4-pentenoate hydratase/2-oxohepta-3-ene-1,7-dioic acid hydratase in catechol pathway
VSFGIGTFQAADGAAYPGLVVDGQVRDLRPEFTSTLQMFRDWDAVLPRLHELAAEGAAGEPLESLRPLPPVEPSGQILCGGANYTKHLHQMIYAQLKRQGDERPDDELRAEAVELTARRGTVEDPFFFIGLPSALAGANDDVILWGPGDEHDWELELAVVIGRDGRRIPESEAMAYVAGYTIVNDVTTRDALIRPDARGLGLDWLAGKNAPTFFPTGPLLVPTAHAGDPSALQITLKVNGRTMQDESTADMLFDVAALIAHISDVAELRPGDLVLTGSPAGNGAHHGVFLKPGDVMEGAITGLGVQRNRCVAEPAPANARPSPAAG